MSDVKRSSNTACKCKVPTTMAWLCYLYKMLVKFEASLKPDAYEIRHITTCDNV